MYNFGSYFLWALAACTLWDELLAKASGHIFLLQELDLEAQNQCNISNADNGINAKLDRLEVEVQGLKSKLEGQETALTKIENQLQAILSKMEDPQQTPKVDNPVLAIPVGFEKIGTRYFRIVNEAADWDTAKRRCRELGGYLASFRSEEELRAFATKRSIWNYWLGINDQDRRGHFVSEASQKPVEFLKWKEGQPEDETHDRNCILLYNFQMINYDCNTDIWGFICQADNET